LFLIFFASAPVYRISMKPMVERSGRIRLWP